MNRPAAYWVTTAFLGSVVGLALAQQQSGIRPQAPVSTLEQGAVSIQQNVVYARSDGADLHLDIYQSPDRGAGPRPAVLLFHGGGWTSYDKSSMRDMGEFLARLGFVAFAVDYRLFQGSESRWPAQLDDAQRAVRWVRANADKYDVDRQRVGAYGFSAGAQLAALLGMEETRDNSDPALARYSSKVQAVVDVSGPADFTTDRNTEDDAFLANFLGAEFSKDPEIWRDASPVFHVSKKNAAFLIVHGTKDPNVPISQAQELYDKLKAAKVPVSFVKVDDVHNFQTAQAARTVAIQTRAFFVRYLEAAP
ncbi:MAG: alpha/beta hydrolase [Candidatus Sulfotelmatobacter sp.]